MKKRTFSLTVVAAQNQHFFNQVIFVQLDELEELPIHV